MPLIRSLRLPGYGGLAALGLLLSAQAGAELGGAMTGVQVDRAHLNARLQSTPSGSHTIHRMTLPNGGAVKEFTNANGRVYAITWSGPGKPDLRSLLGGYFARFQAENAHLDPRARRRPPQVNRPELVIQTGGHMGYFWGVAIVPALTPAGFAATDLQ